MNNRKKSLADLSAVQQLVRLVADSGRMTLKEARTLIELVFEGVTTKTLATGRFSWPGFGTWRTSIRAARNVLNPQTREPMRLEETRGVRWRPSRDLLAKVQKSRGPRGGK